MASASLQGIGPSCFECGLYDSVETDTYLSVMTCTVCDVEWASYAGSRLRGLYKSGKSNDYVMKINNWVDHGDTTEYHPIA
jgi:hypothetical protein